MKVEEIVKEKFLKALKENKEAVWTSPYVGPRVAINRVTKKPYRGINILFLHGEYASYKEWTERGFHPEKGKSELCFFNTRKEYDQLDENGTPILNKKGEKLKKSVWIMRFYYIWERHNVKNDKGEIAPSVLPPSEIDKTPATKREKKAKDILLTYMKTNGITYSETAENMAYFIPAKNHIHMPEKMKSETARIGTLAHECAHSTGASHLLDRKLAEGTSREAYSREELIAETASAIFCTENGVNVDLDNSAAYIKGWYKYINETPAKTIIAAIYQAQKASRLMNGESLAKIKDNGNTKAA